jgi:hypothetical protein
MRRPVALICKASPLRQEHRRDQQLPLLGGCASCRAPLWSLVTCDEPRFAAFLVHIASKDCTPLSEAVPGGYRQGIHTCAPKGNSVCESCHGRLRCAPRAKPKCDRSLLIVSHSPVRQNGALTCGALGSQRQQTSSGLANRRPTSPLATIMTYLPRMFPQYQALRVADSATRPIAHQAQIVRPAISSSSSHAHSAVTASWMTRLCS